MTEELTVETTEVDVDPLITTKLAYVDNLQKVEIEFNKKKYSFLFLYSNRLLCYQKQFLNFPIYKVLNIFCFY